jgi:hypothetical protein
LIPIKSFRTSDIFEGTDDLESLRIHSDSAGKQIVILFLLFLLLIGGMQQYRRLVPGDGIRQAHSPLQDQSGTTAVAAGRGGRQRQ